MGWTYDRHVWGRRPILKEPNNIFAFFFVCLQQQEKFFEIQADEDEEEAFEKSLFFNLKYGHTGCFKKKCTGLD